MSEKKITPCIIIPGFGQSKAELYDENGNTVRQVWPLKADGRQIAKTILKPFLKTVLCRRDIGFTDEIYRCFQSVVEPLATDESGSMKHRVRAVTHPYALCKCEEKVKRYIKKLLPIEPLIQTAGEENIYFFAYNAFEDAYIIAARLDSFIQMVKRDTGSDKVDLLTFSMGGMVSTAYLDAYADKLDIRRVFYAAAALRGSQLQSDILLRNFDKKQGYSLLEFFTSKDTGDTFRKVLAFVPWEVRYGVLRRSFDAIIETAMINSPGMWELQPLERYEEIANRFLSGTEHAALRQTVDRFFAAEKRLPATITTLKEKGVRFYVAAGYSLRMIELSAEDSLSSDSMLAASSASLGATAAPRGQRLSPASLPANSILSPDGEIDASTCALKKETWFFKGLSHREMSRDERIGKLILRAFTDESFTDVTSDSTLPQFN